MVTAKLLVIVKRDETKRLFCSESRLSPQLLACFLMAL
jgi:hypothetical protein